MRNGNGSKFRLRRLLSAGLAVGLALVAPFAHAQQLWGNYGGNPQHTAISSVRSQSLQTILWQTPVDLDPQYTNGEYLLIHYGTPLCTAANTIILPVKTGANDGFRVEARNGANGSLLWSFASDYTLPAHRWTPSYCPTITPNGRIYFAGAGGTVYYRDNIDSTTPGAVNQIAFYGTANYTADKPTYNNAVKICTPLTSDNSGNVYFGYRVSGANPLNLESGIARIGADGSTLYAFASTISNGQSSRVVMNCTPAVSNDGSTVYLETSDSNSLGYLVSVNAATLAPIASVRLKDPSNDADALLLDDGTASPMVAPDGTVFIGVLENPLHTSKGWLLQLNAALTQQKTPGAFGWDDTPSIVPASMVPSYQGASAYLILAKYNNYVRGGGDGVNKMAILDPNDTRFDALTGVTVMKEVLTIAGVTPDQDYVATHPNAVREWCINTAAVDPLTKSVMVNNEDGKLYRWDLTTNTFSESVVLTAGLGEAYTPTIIGRDGKVYAINNAILFAVGLPNVTVSGTVTLQGSLNFVQPVDFTFRTTFGTAFTRVATLNAAGGYSLADVPAGEYTLSIKGAKWLRKNLSVNAAGNVNNVNAQLFAGDANNDNAVDVSDLLLIINHYNQTQANNPSGYLEGTDFNSDGANDVTDLLLVIGNYNHQGDS